MDQKEILAKEMEAIRVDLIANYDALGMRASGQWADQIEAHSERLSGTILGLPYTQQLVTGRPPTSSGAQPGSPTLREKIEVWIEQKGIASFSSDISVSSLAFLIARKIHKEGTQYFRDGGTDLLEKVITPKRIQSIIDKVTEFQISSFTTQIEGFFQEVSQT